VLVTARSPGGCGSFPRARIGSAAACPEVGGGGDRLRRSWAPGSLVFKVVDPGPPGGRDLRDPGTPAGTGAPSRTTGKGGRGDDLPGTAAREGCVGGEGASPACSDRRHYRRSVSAASSDGVMAVVHLSDSRLTGARSGGGRPPGGAPGGRLGPSAPCSRRILASTRACPLFVVSMETQGNYRIPSNNARSRGSSARGPREIPRQRSAPALRGTRVNLAPRRNKNQMLDRPWGGWFPGKRQRHTGDSSRGPTLGARWAAWLVR